MPLACVLYAAGVTDGLDLLLEREDVEDVELVGVVGPVVPAAQGDDRRRPIAPP
jgi:hypothetical protein